MSIGWIHEDGKRDLYFLPRSIIRWYKTRLIISACRTVYSSRFHRLRVKNLHNFVSKNSRIDLWGVKLQHKVRRKNQSRKFFDLKNSDFFHSKLYENENFEIENFSKIFDLNFFRMPSLDQKFSRFCESIFLIFFLKSISLKRGSRWAQQFNWNTYCFDMKTSKIHIASTCCPYIYK